jgi:DNA-binding YbaB/EbfC family protein
MFDKLLAAQQKAEEVKQRLENISVTGEAENGAIKVIANANKNVKSIEIKEDFLAQTDKEGLEELLVVAINKALTQADSIAQAEQAAMTQEMLNSMGGLGALGSLFGSK